MGSSVPRAESGKAGGGEGPPRGRRTSSPFGRLSPSHSNTQSGCWAQQGLLDFVVPHQSFRWMRSSLDPSQASARWSTPEPRGLGGDGRIRALGRMNTAASRRTRVRLGAVHHPEKSRLLGDSLREVALLRRHGPVLSGPQKETALRGGEFPGWRQQTILRGVVEMHP